MILRNGKKNRKDQQKMLQKSSRYGMIRRIVILYVGREA